MSRAIELLREHSEASRRHAILGAFVGAALLILTILVVMEGSAIKGAAAGFAAGGVISAAILTYAKARLWERVAADRQALGGR